MSPIKFRAVARSTSIRSRFKSLSTRDSLQLETIKKLAFMVMSAYRREVDPIRRADLKRKCGALIFISLSIKEDTYGPIERPIRHCLALSDISFYFSKEFLRFRRENLDELYEFMRFPNRVVLENKSVMTGEEVFLRGLYELVTGEKQTSIAEKFGRHPSDQSRAFTYFINHIYRNFHHLVTDNLNWWQENGLMERAAIAIEEKLGVRYDNRFVGFIDCNCLETNRPGGGPCEAGGNSSRWDEEVQRAFYNGWKSIHGLKHQTVDNALGFTMDIIGPYSNRRNDLYLFRDSDINARMARLGWHIFGDSAYHNHSHVKSYGADPVFNRKMKKVRISIEWNYMTTASLFSYVAFKRKFKILESMASGISRVYIVATILRNIHACYYGNLTMNYFNVILPHDFVNSYINQQPVSSFIDYY
jgi:hypothetical protein